MGRKLSKKKIKKMIDRGDDFYKKELAKAKKQRKERKTTYPVGFEYKDRKKQ